MANIYIHRAQRSDGDGLFLVIPNDLLQQVLRHPTGQVWFPVSAENPVSEITFEDRDGTAVQLDWLALARERPLPEGE